jgi:lipocalin
MSSDAGKILRVTDNGFRAVVEPQYMKYVRLSSMSEYNAISQKDPATVYLIGSPSVTYIYLYTQLIWSEN